MSYTLRVLVLLAMAACLPAGEELVGTTSANFLKIPVMARPAAMGEARSRAGLIGADADAADGDALSVRDVDGAGGASVRLSVERWDRGDLSIVDDDVAVEVPCAFIVNGRPFAVMLA